MAASAKRAEIEYDDEEEGELHVVKDLAQLLYASSTAAAAGQPRPTIDLRWKKLDADHLRELVTLLKGKRVSTLDLNGCSIGSAGATIIAELLADNQFLHKIDLGRNNIGRQGGLAIAHALATPNSIAELILEWNNFDDDVLSKGFAPMLRNNLVLTTLDLHCNKFTDVGIADLAEALTQNRTLKLLELRMNKIGDRGASSLASALKKNKTLTQLDVATGEVGPTGVGAIADCLKVSTGVTHCDLESAKVNLQAIKLLSDALLVNKTLQSLSLHRVVLSSELVEALCVGIANCRLTSLVLCRTALGDAGACWLAPAISANKSLTTLDLEADDITDFGFIAICRSLTDNLTLTQLDMPGNKLKGKEESADELCALIAKRTRGALLNLNLTGHRHLELDFVRRVQTATQARNANIKVSFETDMVAKANAPPAPKPEAQHAMPKAGMPRVIAK